MLSPHRFILLTALAALLAASAAPTGKSSPQTVPEDPATSGSSTEPLSEKLNRSGGVIRPPGDVDSGMAQHPPPAGSKSMPVIRPPGAPGINPK